MRNVPGRKRDIADCQWIAELHEHGLLRPSFIPAAEVAALRQRTRYRKRLIEQRTSEGQRLSKVLEDAGIKIDSVASRLLGVSGREMIEALIAGERNPGRLADLARGVLRRKTEDLQMACDGRFTAAHAQMCRLHLDAHDHLTAAIAELDALIAEAAAPFAAVIARLMTIPGIGQRTAEVIVAETGGDMTRFAASARLAAWAGLAPGDNESAGKRKHAAARKGNQHLRAAMTEAAWATARTRTRPGARFRRLARRFRQGPREESRRRRGAHPDLHRLGGPEPRRGLRRGRRGLLRAAGPPQPRAPHPPPPAGPGPARLPGHPHSARRRPAARRRPRPAARSLNHPARHRRAAKPAPPALPHAQLGSPSFVTEAFAMRGCGMPGAAQRLSAYQVVRCVAGNERGCAGGSWVEGCRRWPGTVGGVGDGLLTVFLCGDVMTGRGVDQVLPDPGDPELRERYTADARAYVRLAERAHGRIPRPAGFAWPWGDALPVLEDAAPDVRVINLETSITRSRDFAPGKAIHYRMSPGNRSVPGRGPARCLRAGEQPRARFRPPGAAGHPRRRVRCRAARGGRRA
jgi:transposase